VLVLTNGAKPNVFLSGRNLPRVHVMPYGDVSTYHILWSDLVVIEQGAFEGTPTTNDKSNAASDEKAADKAAKKATRAKATKAKAEKPKAEARSRGSNRCRPSSKSSSGR
jgi:hypothetical protein